MKQKEAPGSFKCRVCSCTDREPCSPPCSWAEGYGDLCSTCLEMVETLAEYRESVKRFNLTGLVREFKEYTKWAVA